MGKLAVVIGGSGFVGRHVVRELARHGWRVRVGVRRPHLATHLKPMGVVGQIQLAQVNIRHRQSIDAALAGADAVINCVGILFQAGSQKFESIQADGAENIAAACAEAGITNLVHVSAIGADAQSKSLYARSKADGESRMRNHVPDAVIMRPSIVFGPEDDFFNRFAAMTRIAPALPLIGGGKTRFQPVYVDDVADAICAVLEAGTFKGTTFELGGPQIYTFRALMELMLREIGVRRALVPLPFSIAALMGLGGQMMGALPFLDPFLTRDQVRLLKKDNVVTQDDPAIATLETLCITPTSVEAILPSYMVQYRKHGQFTEDQAA
ncbi:MAG: complex I NDUFA9 subunit family protein [Pseudomonadota bacterium]